jgi:CO/xanthine dehydrogenase Mo-binding subunit
MTVAEKISSGFSRRSVLTGGLAGGFLLAFHLPVRAVNEPVQPPDDTAGKFAPNAFIRVDNTGKTTLVMPQVEMGQGIYTALAAILAEEMDADFSGFKRREARRRSGRSGSRCARPAPARAPCWCRLRPSNGRSIRQAARRRTAK